jgi:hypothetical protein
VHSGQPILGPTAAFDTANPRDTRRRPRPSAIGSVAIFPLPPPDLHQALSPPTIVAHNIYDHAGCLHEPVVRLTVSCCSPSFSFNVCLPLQYLHSQLCCELFAGSPRTGRYQAT